MSEFFELIVIILLMAFFVINLVTVLGVPFLHFNMLSKVFKTHQSVLLSATLYLIGLVGGMAIIFNIAPWMQEVMEKEIYSAAAFILLFLFQSVMVGVNYLIIKKRMNMGEGSLEQT